MGIWFPAICCEKLFVSDPCLLAVYSVAQVWRPHHLVCQIRNTEIFEVLGCQLFIITGGKAQSFGILDVEKIW